MAATVPYPKARGAAEGENQYVRKWSLAFLITAMRVRIHLWNNYINKVLSRFVGTACEVVLSPCLLCYYLSQPKPNPNALE